jgi:hypothetical protein
MTCAQLHDVAAELALGVLTGRERATAIAHLEKCRACREEVRQLMAVGGLLPELLPPVEPPAGFETRVLQRLGASVQSESQSEARPLPRPERSPRHRGSIRGGARPDGHQPSASRPGAGRPGDERPRHERPSGEQPPSMTRGGAGESGGPGRVRRALAATAMGLAVIAAALGGWRIVGPSPSASSATARLTSASLLSATRSSVGSVFLYSGTPRWLYMSVDLGSGDEFVTCQVVGADGRASTVGSFQLADGYGTWGSPDPGNVGAVTGARLLSADGVVLATATFPH